MSGYEITIPLKDLSLSGQLDFGFHCCGLVIFAHGSGSSRHSPRNQQVARILRQAGLGTLLFDLLTVEEEQAEARTGYLRFDIPLLAKRLEQVTRWALESITMHDVATAYFGSSTGAAAALLAATLMGDSVGAIVSRGGRPDLAAEALEKVSAPTLFIVGGNDLPVLMLNEEAYERLRCQKALRIIQGASHLFEEPGRLDTVARMAAEWFVNHLQPLAQRSR